MPTVTATPYTDEAYVRVDADWTDQPAVTHARVIRTNTVTGEQAFLRPYIDWNTNGDLRLTCGLGMWWDTEPPIDTAVTYRTEAADIPVNAALNSSFEGSVASWTVVGGTFASSATFSHSGANSGLLTPTGGVFTNAVAQAGIPVTGGRPATLSLWVLTPQGWNSVRAQIRWLNSSGTFVGARELTPIEILDDAEWRYITLTATAPADAVTAEITFIVVGTAPNTTLFYVDQFELTQLQPVAAYAVTGSVTVDADHPYYLKDPVNPCHDVAMERCFPGPDACPQNPAGVMVHDYGRSETYEPNAVVLLPLDDEFPLTVSRRRRAASSLTLSIITRTFVDRDALKLLLSAGTVLFFQAPPEYGISDRYIDVAPYTINAPIKDLRIQPRFFTLPHSLRRRPAGPANGVCGARIADLCDLYTTWSAMVIAGLTWTDLMLGAASPYGPGQPPVSGLRTYDDVNADFASYNAINDGVRTYDGLLAGL